MNCVSLYQVSSSRSRTKKSSCKNESKCSLLKKDRKEMKVLKKKHKIKQDMLDTGTEVNSSELQKKRKTAKKPVDVKYDTCKDGKWTEEEHQRFLKALELYGNTWKKVEAYIGTRSTAQIRSHAQKHFRRLRTQAFAEMKKNDQLENNVFIVVREYRNNTYNSITASGSDSKEEKPCNQNTPATQEANTVILEDTKSTTGKIESEQILKTEEPVYCCSENEMMKFKDIDEKSDLENGIELLKEDKSEVDLDFDSALYPVQISTQKLNFEKPIFMLFDERDGLNEGQDEDISQSCMMRVKYEP